MVPRVERGREVEEESEDVSMLLLQNSRNKICFGADVGMGTGTGMAATSRVVIPPFLDKYQTLINYPFELSK